MYSVINPTQTSYVESKASIKIAWPEGQNGWYYRGIFMNKLPSPDKRMAIACTSSEGPQSSKVYQQCGGMGFGFSGGVTYGGPPPTYAWLVHLNKVASCFFDGHAEAIGMYEAANDVDNGLTTTGSSRGLQDMLLRDESLVNIP